MKNIFYYEDNMIEVVLENEHLKVHLINMGASIFKLYYNNVDVIVGPKKLNEFIKTDHYYGKTIGRFSGRLPLNFSVKELKNLQITPYKSANSSIHGGENGFSTKRFNYHPTKENEAVFSLVSFEENNDLPGDIYVEVKYELILNELIVSYYATTTKTTILNITNHSYFNLDNSKTILNHKLKINANKFVEFDDKYNILGLKEVDNTVYDFKEYVELKKPLKDLKNKAFKGLDTIFLLNEKPLINLYSPKNKTNLEITTSYPSVVCYTHNQASPDNLDYYQLWPFAGIALECEYEPGGTLTDFLSDGVLKENDKYHHFVKYRFTKK